MGEEGIFVEVYHSSGLSGDWIGVEGRVSVLLQEEVSFLDDLCFLEIEIAKIFQKEKKRERLERQRIFKKK